MLGVVFGAVLRKHRLLAELTQEQLAFEAGIERSYVSMLERGRNQPTLAMLFAIAKALNCSPSTLIAEVEQTLQTRRRSKKALPKATAKRVTRVNRKASPSGD
ncbi:helix-turn-helix domain-containing protein [Paraburkholderia tuberum]|uniref:helix-turn-helix domain-containing protein n=1 Tax=Paraburkholderia tuberum TaxID=157910 RepID=UPI001FC7BCA0|nr:helix-turn-helix transcriptional regulator [Paraburkholderia tuberum]